MERLYGESWGRILFVLRDGCLGDGMRNGIVIEL